MSDPKPLDLERTTTLGNALGQVGRLERGWSLYVRADATGFTDDSPILLVYDVWDDVEGEASRAGWTPGLSAEDASDVVLNAEAQNRGRTEDLVVAFEYYLAHDAFISFGQPD